MCKHKCRCVTSRPLCPPLKSVFTVCSNWKSQCIFLCKNVNRGRKRWFAPVCVYTSMFMRATNSHASLPPHFCTIYMWQWWLPSENKQRDLLSMTERPCTSFHSVRKASTKLPQSAHSRCQHQVSSGVCVVSAGSHLLEWCCWVYLKMWTVQLK